MLRWGTPCLLALATVAGCATVDPRPDFDRAQRMVAARTGVERVYNPETASAIEPAVTALLADGLTTDEAVQVALLNSKRFQALFQRIGVSRAEVVQAGLLPNPSLGISNRFPDGGGRSNLTVNFAQQLADLWRIPVRKRIAKAAMERTILEIVHEATVLAADVKRDCYQLIALRQLEAIAGDGVDLAERSLKLAEDRFQAGEVGKVDVNLARADVLSVRLRAMAVRRDRRVAETTLANILGLARWRDPWTLEDTLPHEALPFEDDESLLVFAMGQRLDARAAAMKVRGAEDEIERQYLRIFPNVTLGVELERPERRAQPRRHVLADTARASVANGRLTAPSIQSRAERKRARSQIVDSLLGPTLNITLPIFDQNQAKIAKARFAATQARKEYEAILDNVARETKEALIVARSASKLVTFFEQEALPNARNTVEVAQNAYRAGRSGVLALIDAQRTLVAQREADVVAERDYATALAEMRRATGGRFPSEAKDETPPDPTSDPDVEKP